MTPTDRRVPTAAEGLGGIVPAAQSLTFCDCGEVRIPVGALSVWFDGTTHTETACIGGAA